MSDITKSVKPAAGTTAAASAQGSGAANPLQMGAVLRPARPQSPASEAGDYGETVGAQGIHRQVDAGKVLMGRPPRGPDRRKFKYDVYAGRASPLRFAVTRDDRMPADEAGLMLHRIHEVMGVGAADPEVLYAFDRGMFFCHTVNGASVLNPGRSKWSVPGTTESFDFKVVVDMLGPNLRRFFRAFADEILAANKYVLDTYDPNDISSVEHHGWLVEVAAERGLTRYPQLAHDSADACTELNSGERQAVMNSKRMVIGAVVNSADRMRNTSRVQSADGFDSSVGHQV